MKKCCRKTDMCSIVEEVKELRDKEENRDYSDFIPVTEVNSISVQIKMPKDIFEQYSREAEFHGDTPEEFIAYILEDSVNDI